MDPIQTPVQIPDFEPKPNYLKTIIFSVLIIITLSLIGFLFFQNQQLKTESKVTNFIECSAIKGALIQYSYPATCVLPSGKSFTQELSPEEKSNLIPPKEIITEPSTSISPDETAGWKTYVNKELSIEFKYPENWKYVSDCKFGTICFSSEDFEQIVNEVGDGGGFYIAKKGGLFSISSSPKDTTITLDNYCHPGGPLLISSCDDTKMEGLDAKKRILNIQDGAEYATEIGTLTNKFLIMLGQNYSSQPDKKILNQILSTFKFIDDGSVCVPTYQVETNSVELTAEQNYSVRCTEQRSEKDCFSIDLYNQKADDFSIPDGIPDCIWKNPTK